MPEVLADFCGTFENAIPQGGAFILGKACCNFAIAVNGFPRAGFVDGVFFEVGENGIERVADAKRLFGGFAAGIDDAALDEFVEMGSHAFQESLFVWFESVIMTTEVSLLMEFFQHSNGDWTLGEFVEEVVKSNHLFVGKAVAVVGIEPIGSVSVSIGSVLVGEPFHLLPLGEAKKRWNGVGRGLVVSHGGKEKG